MNISQILKLKDVTPQSRNNVNKYLTRLSTMFNWGMGQGYFDENFIKGMKLPVSKSEKSERQSCSDEDLLKILSPRSYLNHTINFGKITKSNQPDVVKLQNCYYWIFLGLILSGMRTNEMCQLKISDIQLDEGIWMFNID